MSAVLGISPYCADAAAALIVDGVLVAAAEESRFNRARHSSAFPRHAAAFCLASQGLAWSDLDDLALVGNPTAQMQEHILFVLSGRPAYTKLIQDRFQSVARHVDWERELPELAGPEAATFRGRVHRINHPLAHLADAFVGSRFDDAAVLCIDGMGDFASTAWGVGSATGVRLDGTILFPHSLGLLATMFAQLLGFREFGGEARMAGAAAHGKPVHVDAVRQTIALKPGGRFELVPRFFTHPEFGLTMLWPDGVPRQEELYTSATIELFGPPRLRYEDFRPNHRDLAASVQEVIVDAVLHIAKHVRDATGKRRLCYTGLIATDSRVNAKLLASRFFDEIYIPPAVTDAGTAVGAAALVAYGDGSARRTWPFTAALGPTFSVAAIDAAIRHAGRTAHVVADPAEAAAEMLQEGKLVGWFQDRMEFGPRALGHRSILADPRKAEVRQRLNREVKFREALRPFAASVLEERAAEIVVEPVRAPFMEFLFTAREEWRARLAAVVHADGSLRAQTVAAADEPLFHRLISEFTRRTGCPAVLNTSFNEDTPIVRSPADAIACFENTGLDALVLGDRVITT